MALTHEHMMVLDLIAMGYSQQQAWQQIYKNAKIHASATGASRLMKRPAAIAYLKEAQERRRNIVWLAYQKQLNSIDKSIVDDPDHKHFASIFKTLHQSAVPKQVEITHNIDTDLLKDLNILKQDD